MDIRTYSLLYAAQKAIDDLLERNGGPREYYELAADIEETLEAPVCVN